MKWITRERPKIDRIACPWLIRRFIDPEPEFIFVPAEQVLSEAARLSAIPYDIAGVEHTHYGSDCTFDYFVRKYAIDDPAIQTIATIVRGADTNRFDLAPQAAGLWAISAGLSVNYANDQEQLAMGMHLYDALYSWARYAHGEIHTWKTNT